MWRRFCIFFLFFLSSLLVNIGGRDVGKQLQSATSIWFKKSIESLKSEIQIRKLVTQLDKKKQTLVVALFLTGRARSIALEMSAEDFNTGTVMDWQLKIRNWKCNACSDITFSNMKSSLKEIFGDNSPQGGACAWSDPDSTYDIIYCTGKRDRSSSQSQIPMPPGPNPLDNYGRGSLCAVC